MRSILSSWVWLQVLILSISLSAYGASPTEKPVENVAVKYGGGDVAFLKSAGINIVLDRVGDMQLREECRKQGVKYYRIYNIFYPSRPKIDVKTPPLVSDQGKPPVTLHKTMFVPSHEEARQAKIEAIRLDMQKFKPDGISLDFIRFHLEYDNNRDLKYRLDWEEVPEDGQKSKFISFSFDPYSLNRFQKETGIKLEADVNNSAKAAKEIFKKHHKAWTRWKCGLMTDMAAKIRKRALAINPKVQVMLHLIPWRTDEYDGALLSIAGQDPVELAKHVDIFAPMVYHPFLNRKASWVGEYTRYLQKLTGKKVWPCIQAMPIKLKDHDDPRPFSLEEMREAWLSAAATGTNGITLYGPSGSDTETFELLQSLTGNSSDTHN